jgi:hypothetical protein
MGISDPEKDADQKMTRHREICVEKMMSQQTKMVEACHDFIFAVMEMQKVGLPHRAEDDGYWADCLQMARDYLKQHYELQDKR